MLHVGFLKSIFTIILISLFADIDIFLHPGFRRGPIWPWVDCTGSGRRDICHKAFRYYGIQHGRSTRTGCL